ncbi:MAG: enoyl-CoA hydratase/isomerase family protein, partial [Planctomycetes bacterium]|nr:enoyl-CoA hydratase/isomerase family protein [Planctomycetota bacterium]
MPEVNSIRACDGQVLRLVVDKPKGNIFAASVMQALAGHVREAQKDTALKLVTIEAAGKHFSFGASVEEHTRDKVGVMLPGLRELVLAMVGSEVPVAALVQGLCLGGAFEVVLAAHLVFAAPDAKMGVPEIRLGVFPPAACALLPKKLGQAAADRLILTGEEMTGEELHRLGLVHRLFPAEGLWAGVEAWFAGTFGKFSASSLRHANRNAQHALLCCLEDRLKKHEQDYVERLMASHDANEGIAAFMERRDPK